MGESKFRALIVDDEPPARAVIRRMVAEDPEIEVIGECSNGCEAVEVLPRLAPDLLFLDIRMPEMDGFALLEALDENRMPAVVFVTAFDRYAVRAFEFAAVDYLLKPFDHERMEKALKRAKANLREKNNDERTGRMLALLTELHAKSDYLERFVIKSNGRVLLVPTRDVDWIEAEGNYLALHVGNATHLIRETMSGVEQRLDPRKFLRVHRSTMVNIDSVKELLVHVNNDEYLVLLKNGDQVTMSRRCRDKISHMLGASI